MLYTCMQGRRFLSGLLAAAAAAAPASAVVRFRGCGGASTNARCARVSLGHCLKRREAVAQGANVLRLAKLEASLLVARMRHRRGPHEMRNVQVGNRKQQGASFDFSVAMLAQDFQVLLRTFSPGRAAVHTKHAMGAQRNAAEAQAQGRSTTQ